MWIFLWQKRFVPWAAREPESRGGWLWGPALASNPFPSSWPSCASCLPGALPREASGEEGSAGLDFHEINNGAG